MSSEPAAITLSSICKEYMVYEKPSHRLWQMIFRGKRSFHRVYPVLSGVSFSVYPGETVGLVGRNGSGKSTLLGIVCGTISPTAGEVSVNGRVAALLELGAGFNPELSGGENIELCAKIYGLSDLQITERYDSIVEFADIGDYIDQPVRTYSSGMFTRLAFAVVAHVDADVLVVDEALAVGDAYFVQKCMRYLAGFREAGGTLLFVSHDIGSITSLCDRAIWLRGGVVAIDGSPKDVANAYLADLYASQQGEVAGNAVPASGETAVPEAGGHDDDPADLRSEILTNSSLRNDIKVFAFSPGHDFGLGGARILDAKLSGRDGKPMPWIVGGERAVLDISIRTDVDMASPIIGFVVKDRQGQPLFGDNTFLLYPEGSLPVHAGEELSAKFEFRMPILARGSYSISIAIADGSQLEHVVHQWIHDAIQLSSHADSLATGLVGIPMHRITLQRSV